MTTGSHPPASVSSHCRIPLPRKVLWALLGLGMMRAGEVAGLRWERLDLGTEPLGRIAIITSYDHDKTKTETEFSSEGLNGPITDCVARH